MFPELDSRPSCYNAHRFPHFERPRMIGFFSVNGMRDFVPDASQLKFARSLSVGPVNYDLNLKLSEVMLKKNGLNERLKLFLQFILFDKNRIKPKMFAKSLREAKFVCYRGLLTCLATTPYENSEPWRIIVTFFHGSIFMCTRETEDKKARNRNMTEKELQCTSWGYKFEQFILSESPFSNPDPNEPCNENEEFSLVFQNKINNHELFYCAEVDGISVDKSPDPQPPPDKEMGYDGMLEYLRKQLFVELKTSRHIEHPNQERNFRRFKAKKWWCQSFLAGVEDILCGFRNDDGTVEELKLYDVLNLPKHSQQHWNPNVCFQFLDTFLSHVKKCLSHCIIRKYGEGALNNLENVGKITLHFEWAPRQSIRVTDNYDKEFDNIIPDWFEREYGDK